VHTCQKKQKHSGWKGLKFFNHLVYKYPIWDFILAFRTKAQRQKNASFQSSLESLVDKITIKKYICSKFYGNFCSLLRIYELYYNSIQFLSSTIKIWFSKKLLNTKAIIVHWQKKWKVTLLILDKNVFQEIYFPVFSTM
jgi:hypothetical protein